METALQELISTLELDIKAINEHDSKEDKYYRSGLKYALDLAKEKLQKEKEQIQRAFNVGGTEAYETASEDYYNENFGK